jgi:DNA mismatch endonuclease (patch repair protein)
MQAVKSKNTSPEKAVRSLLHALGYRYRLHCRDLPGCPDIVFPGRKTAIFVHGCFWHGHDCPRGRREPESNAEYWRKKRAANAERDRKVLLVLSELGWRAMIVWECEIRDKKQLASRLVAFLGPTRMR